MTSTSPESAVVRTGGSETVRTLVLDTDLRSGGWTRLGGSGVLGDPVTESTMNTLAERTRAAARAQGYAAGWAEGGRAAQSRAAGEEARAAQTRAEDRDAMLAEHDVALTALRAAAARLDAATEQVCAHVESGAVELALQVAAAVLGREVVTATEPGADAVRRAVSLLSPTGHGAGQPTGLVTVRLHPADLATLDPQTLLGRGVHLVDDPSLARGDAVAETDVTVVDATIAAALARVREVLAP